MFRVFLFLFLLSIANISYSQNPYDSIGNSLQAILNIASTANQGASNGQAAIINAQGNYELKHSQALINVEEASTLHMQNRIRYAQTYFEMRQINRYYRDLEAWQYQEKQYLKRYGIYDRENIEKLYGIRR
jgi:hypothetical protein